MKNDELITATEKIPNGILSSLLALIEQVQTRSLSNKTFGTAIDPSTLKVRFYSTSRSYSSSEPWKSKFQAF
jgi:hypothetical protein